MSDFVMTYQRALERALENLRQGKFETSKLYGEYMMGFANSPRLAFNAHILLGEIAVKMGEIESAKLSFTQALEIAKDLKDDNLIKNAQEHLDEC